MSKYLEVKYAVKGREEKTYWHRCGTAFPMKDGNGFNIILDAIPCATENGQIRLSIFEPRERNERESRDDFDPRL